jgi:hypothetical protein
VSKLFLLAGLVTLPACPLLDLQVDVPEVCVTYRGIQVDAVPEGQMMVEQSFTLDDLGPLAQLAEQDGSDVRFLRAEVRATSGLADFGFVHQATLTVASGDPSSTLPSVDVFDCEDCATSDATLDVEATSPIDSRAYVQSGSLVVTIALAGQAPTEPWTMDVDICMSGSAEYQVAP